MPKPILSVQPLPVPMYSVLRHFGIEAKGEALYEQIPNKMRNGYVYPKGIPKLLERYGIKARYHKGNMNTLKQELIKGNPVIVLIRYQKDKNWLHYVPVVGFDEDAIYLADSLKELVNTPASSGYNRKVPTLEFEKLWQTSLWFMPFYSYTYFSIEREKERPHRKNK